MIITDQQLLNILDSIQRSLSSLEDGITEICWELPDGYSVDSIKKKDNGIQQLSKEIDELRETVENAYEL